jgi:3-hydroxyacyl-CoA dehydrogenase / enoyl-CoA hydratase / 3-hydroxybutyryl-CoA epimerase
LQQSAEWPNRLVGCTFHDDKTGRNVCEIVPGPATDSAAIAFAESNAHSWGYRPFCVADRPGRLLRYIRMAYFSEAASLVREGLPPAEVDRALLRAGFSVAPLSACDEEGLSAVTREALRLRESRGDRFASTLSFERMIERGFEGRANGEGFYRYGKRTAKSNDIARMVLWRDLDDDHRAHYYRDVRDAIHEGVERVILRVINDVAGCLSEEPVADPAGVDALLAYGIGCLPGHGGPLRHAESLGLNYIVRRLEYLADRFGPRFQPCDELIRRADAAEGFYANPNRTPLSMPIRRAA